MAIDPTYLNLFLDEAVEILNNWEKDCFSFELGEQAAAVEGLYRGAHNLKSGSAAVGFTSMSAFIHRVEDLLSSVGAGKIQNSPELVRFFLDVHTLMITWLAGLRSNPDHLPTDEKAKLEKDLESFAGGNTHEAEGALPPSSTELKTTPVPDAVKAVDPQHDTEHEHTQEEHPEQAAPTSSQPAAHPVSKQPRVVESVRVPANKLDLLIQLVGDLSTQQAIIWHGWQNGALNSKSCDNAIQLIQKNCKELQGVALSLRMQPLEPLFQRLERAARDLSRKQEKKIEVETRGDHVELDKVVIERVTEALMHVIRNAIDHGIEKPEARLEQGKKASAKLTLEGSQEPGGIAIKISDDGRGLDLDRILKKAVEKGLARSDQNYSDAEIQRFIFLPGFSTAEKLSDVSGRGVGMDIVKNAVQSIGGGISIQSAAGRGTTFSISLPTTLSIVDSLIIKAAGNHYAVPLQDVGEIIDLSSFKLETASSRGRMLSLRSSVVPVEYLKDHLPKTGALNPLHTSNPLNLPSNPVEKRLDSIQPALLVRAGTDTLAFQIDYVVGQQAVSIRTLPSGLDVLPGFTGATILGDGDPCIILNLPALARLHIERIAADIRAQAKLGEDPREVANTEKQSDQDQHRPIEQAPELRHLVFKIHETTLATPLLSVREILPDVPYSTVIGGVDHILGRIDVRGQILPVIDLARSMHLRKEKSVGPLIVIENEQQTVAVVVDRIEAVADLIVTDSGDSSGVARYRGELITTIDLKNLSNDFSVTLEAV